MIIRRRRPIAATMPRQRPRPLRASFNAILSQATPGFTASNLASGLRHGPRCGRGAKAPTARRSRKTTRPIWPSPVERYPGLSISIASPCCEPHRTSTVPIQARRPGTRCAGAARGRFRRLRAGRKQSLGGLRSVHQRRRCSLGQMETRGAQMSVSAIRRRKLPDSVRGARHLINASTASSLCEFT
jgi:hypothetical protein